MQNSFGSIVFVALLSTLFAFANNSASADINSNPPSEAKETSDSSRAKNDQQRQADDKEFKSLSCVNEVIVPSAKDPYEAQINDMLRIRLDNFERWVELAKHYPELTARMPQSPSVLDLRLFLNNKLLDGVYLDYYNLSDDGKTYWIAFQFIRNDANRKTWAALLNHPEFKRPIEVSLGFENGWILPTKVRANSKTPFSLILLPFWRTVSGFVVILVALLLFIWLSRTTEIICDPHAPLCPDGQMPYSLARFQMAFWFFLVISSFFFLWAITAGDTDTITTSVVTVLGISSGAALGSAVVDAGKSSVEDRLRYVAPVDFSLDRKTILEVLREKIRMCGEQLSKSLAESRTETASSKEDTAAEVRNQNELRLRLLQLKSQLKYLKTPPFYRFFVDLVTENGVISFHRFQMFVWTVVLGIIFVIDVYETLAMPEFNGTLLGLLGISAGTYVGFKIPESKRNE